VEIGGLCVIEASPCICVNKTNRCKEEDRHRTTW
jgi:hypothetical protein